MPLFQEKGFEMDENGRTCLHYAVWGGSPRVMRYLVEWCGFDLELRTAVSFAYLIYHTYSGKIDTMIHTLFVYLHTEPTHAYTVHEAPLCPHVCMSAVIELMQIVQYEICHSTYVGILPRVHTI